MINALFILLGIGIWAPGLEEIVLSPHKEPYRVSPPVQEWRYKPIISAKAALVIERESAGILYEKNIDDPLPMASLTKLMTALLILENQDIDELVKITKASSQTEGTSMKLQEGEFIRVKNLLKGLLISSGNDAAIALALYNTGTTVADFVEKMNKRSKELFLKNTHFENPHGFDSPHHYSSARDLAFLTNILLHYDFIRDVVKTREENVSSIDDKEIHHLFNTNQLLGSIFPVYGFKTGTTDLAGECLVLLVKQKSKEYIVVILGSQNRYLDAKTLLFPLLF